jgi:hypothetical protein
MLNWHMRHLHNSSIGIILFVTAFSGCAQAEYFRLLPKAEQVAAKEAMSNAYTKAVLPFAKARTASLNGQSSVPQIFLEQSAFVWDLNGEKLIAMVGAISDDVSPLAKCVIDPSNSFDDKCDWARWRSSTCHLFVNKMTGEMIGAYQIRPYDRAWGFRGRSRCSGVLAVSESKTKPDGMLLTLIFSDSMADADAKIAPPLKADSFLFTPIKVDSGLSFVQEIDCLAHQAEASTVAKAREFLKACPKR